MKVLLVEDDCSVAMSIEMILRAERFQVFTTELGGEAVDLGKVTEYDLIILDLNLPDMSGYEVLRTLRLAAVQTPILILSGIAGIEAKVKGFGFGADEYVTKPFHKAELLARIQAVLRRGGSYGPSFLDIGSLRINLDAKTAQIGQRRVNLTSKEYELLLLLAQRQGTTISKEMILNHLYGGMDEPELKIIDVFVCKIRKKISEVSPRLEFIETVWGRGYMLVEPAMPLEQEAAA